MVVEGIREQLWWERIAWGFGLLFVAALASGVTLLAAYLWLQPTHDLGAFLYAGAFMGFTAAFHLLAVREFMMFKAEKPDEISRNVTYLEEGKMMIRKRIGGSPELDFQFHSEDDEAWHYIVTETDAEEPLRWMATISRNSGEVNIKLIEDTEGNEHA